MVVFARIALLGHDHAAAVNPAIPHERGGVLMRDRGRDECERLAVELAAGIAVIHCRAASSLSSSATQPAKMYADRFCLPALTQDSSSASVITIV